MHYAVDCGHVDCVKEMLNWGANSILKDKQGKNAFDLSTSTEIYGALQQFSRTSIDSINIPSPIGEVTTYVVNETGENDKGVNDKYALPLRCSLVSPVTEKSSLTCQLYPIYSWLEKIHLEEYYEILIDAGYDDIQAMVEQMNGPMPICDKNLKEIGINKPGHQKYLLIKLEQEAGLSKKIVLRKHAREKSNGIMHCCNAHGTRNMFSPPNLLEWLDELELGKLYTLLIDSGYDAYEILIDVQHSSSPLTNKLLETEAKIPLQEDRLKLLNRLEQDIKNYYYEEDKESQNISFDEPKRMVCESCSVF